MESEVSHCSESASNMATLQHEVRRLAASFNAPSDEPPATMAELIVMCLVLHPRSSAEFIQDWIFETSAYYRKALYRGLWERTLKVEESEDPDDPDEGRKAVDCAKLFRDAFRWYETPVCTAREEVQAEDRVGAYSENEDGETSPWPGMLEGLLETARWDIQSTGAVRIFLAKHLARKDRDRKPFPFMRLPPELRLRVYEMVLGFPRSGVEMYQEGGRVLRHDGHGRAVWTKEPKSTLAVRLLTRDYDDECSISDTHHALPLATWDVNTVFALLLVDKQLYEEAMPVFYSINTFVCRSTDTSRALLMSVPEPRLNHLTHIKFTWLRRVYFEVEETFRRLSSCKRLRRIDIHVDSEEHTTNRRNYYPVKNLLELHGIQSLLEMTVRRENPVQIAFEGNCEILRNHFETQKALKAEEGKRQEEIRLQEEARQVEDARQQEEAAALEASCGTKTLKLSKVLSSVKTRSKVRELNRQ